MICKNKFYQLMNRRIDLGEYVVTIYYNEINSELIIKVFDEGGDMIDSINVTDDDDVDDKTKPDINMN